MKSDRGPSLWRLRNIREHAIYIMLNFQKSGNGWYLKEQKNY